MVKFVIEQKLQALNLLKANYSSQSVAQIIGAGSHQMIDNWAAQYQHFGVQGLRIKHTPKLLWLIQAPSLKLEKRILSAMTSH